MLATPLPTEAESPVTNIHPDRFLCYALKGQDTAYTDVFDATDDALTRSAFDDPSIIKAARICLRECGRTERCVHIAERWLKTGRVTGIVTNSIAPYMIGGHVLTFDDDNKRMLIPVDISDNETEPVQACVFPPVPEQRTDEKVLQEQEVRIRGNGRLFPVEPLPLSLMLVARRAEMPDEPQSSKQEELPLETGSGPDNKEPKVVSNDPGTEQEVPSMEEFAESRARRLLTEKETAVSERLAAGPAAFHELLGVLRKLNPKAEPKDLLKILSDLKLRLMSDKQGPQLTRAEKSFSDKTSFNMYGIGTSQHDLDKAAEDLHTIEAQGSDAEKTRLPAKNMQPSEQLLSSFEAYCQENNNFFITFKKGSISAFVGKKGIYSWKEVLGAPTSYHIYALMQLMQAEQPTDIKDMFAQLTGQRNILPNDRQFVDFEIAATLIVQICQKANVLKMRNSMSHPRDAKDMWLIRRMKSETE